MSTLVLRGSKNGEIKRRYQLKSTENKHNRKTESKRRWPSIFSRSHARWTSCAEDVFLCSGLHGKTSGMQRTRRAAAAIELPSSTCNMLQWPKGPFCAMRDVVYCDFRFFKHSPRTVPFLPLWGFITVTFCHICLVTLDLLRCCWALFLLWHFHIINYLHDFAAGYWFSAGYTKPTGMQWR